MADLIASLRSQHVALVLACQGFAQVEERYGKAGAETILSSTSTHVDLPGVGQREAEFYARRIARRPLPPVPRANVVPGRCRPIAERQHTG